MALQISSVYFCNFGIPAESIIDKRDFLISGTEVPNNFLGEAKVTLLDPQENEIKRKALIFSYSISMYKCIVLKVYI